MKTTLVVTTIQGPNAVMRALAEGATRRGADFVVMGDRKSPPQYSLDGARYYSLEQQFAAFPRFGRQLPVGHYVRKNLGYLAALEGGCQWIVETDDDNFPLDGFFTPPPPHLSSRWVEGAPGWINAYDFFSPTHAVWPRGFPLENLQARAGQIPTVTHEIAPVLVQGLADDNPDVDAVYRLTRPLPVRFDAHAQPLTLNARHWCPFNSQNTWFRRDIAVLAYLPAYCSFRMTDIWRSFVAQRCLWQAGHALVFTAPTVRQERNEHDLLRDFADEVPGYLHNARIARILDETSLSANLHENLKRCYVALVQAAILPEAELVLVNAWIEECVKRGC